MEPAEALRRGLVDVRTACAERPQVHEQAEERAHHQRHLSGGPRGQRRPGARHPGAWARGVWGVGQQGLARGMRATCR